MNNQVYDVTKVEAEVNSFWEKTSAFFSSNQKRTEKNFIFYDGPPFATGVPHYGHLLVGTIKDVVARYKNMSGYCVPRQWGWDCHGIPVESLVQKKMNLTRVDIVRDNLVKEFNQECRESVLNCADQWKNTISRLGRWVDFDNSYKTMDKNYMESVWWAFKQIFDQKRIYKAKKIMPYSCKLQTTLSNHEIHDSYKQVEDPFVIVKFKVVDADYYILVYTTTPWTLPSNSGICLNPNEKYSLVKDLDKNEKYLLATNLVPKLFDHHQYEVLNTNYGSFYEGMKYHSLFDDMWFPIVTDSYVTVNDGTGAVHLAPLFGEDDYRVGLKYDLAMWDFLDAQGIFLHSVGEEYNYYGLFCKDADQQIIKDLKDAGRVFKYGTIKHDYPFCDRTNSPLIYRAVDAWYLKLEDVKDRLLKNNATIKWVPKSVGVNRFANWLENAKDWNISRNRLWGSCLPIWESDQGDLVCFGSIAELENFSGAKVEDLHKDHLDKIVFSKDGKLWKRVPEVLDCWFESGCMPYAQYHYPFENRDLVEKNFPADFIVEGLDQTRGWFYTLLVLSTLLFDTPPFKNVIVNGLVLAEDGTKMSKSKNNYTDVNLLLDIYGADALRVYFCSSSVLHGEPLTFNNNDLSTVSRSLFNPLINALEFYKLYSNLDSWKLSKKLPTPSRSLDSWILTKLHDNLIKIKDQLDQYNLECVVPMITSFINDDLCNWYIRLSRKLFWEEVISNVKDQAYVTLHYVLLTIAKMLAPFAPFISEYVYHQLGYEGSIHWENFPIPPLLSKEDLFLIERMQTIRNIASMAHNLRLKNNLKVRQPLNELTICGSSLSLEEDLFLLKEELNVKSVILKDRYVSSATLKAKANFKSLGKRCGKNMPAMATAISLLSHEEIVELQQSSKILLGISISEQDIIVSQIINDTLPIESNDGVTIILNTSLTDDLLREGDYRELCSVFQTKRKESQLKVTDKINVRFNPSNQNVLNFLEEYLEKIKKQVLAISLILDQTVMINETKLSIGFVNFNIEKA